MIFSLTIDPNVQLLINMYGYKVAVTGNNDKLGNWQNVSKTELKYVCGRRYRVEVKGIYCELEYKYVLVTQENEIKVWQDGNNYKLDYAGDEVTTEDHPLFKDAYPRVTGLVLPLFSMRTQEDAGIGEYPDIKKLTDVAKAWNMNVIQLLPINDTILTKTKADSYPYNPLSVFALNPLYIRLREVAGYYGVKLTETEEERGRMLNGWKKVAYEDVLEYKTKTLERIYGKVSEKVEADDGIKMFAEDEKTWLEAYAAFCVMRDKTGTSDFNTWGKYAKYTKKNVEEITKTNKKGVDYYVFIQYHAHRQLSEAVEYARSHGIMLKGDIPIGVSPCSVDVWMNPKNFNMKVMAGAPPDFFSEKGQNWGFPTYNWDEMAKNGFGWWKARLKHLAKYFQAYRIDHILGFFRIWSIPGEEEWGLLGRFYKSLPLTEEEIRNYGINFDREKMTRAYVTEEMTIETFGRKAEQIKKKYLKKNRQGEYDFKAEYKTQRSIEASMYDGGKTELTSEEMTTMDKLMKLSSQKLFLKDNERDGMYHPRISKERNAAYMALNEEERQAYDRLYYDYFYVRHNEYWREQAMAKLPALINATSMIVCGEDLGMIPACVPDVMKELKLMSLEIQTMPKQEGREFDDLSRIPYYSVLTTTTHDMAPLRLWWHEGVRTERRDVMERYWREELNGNENTPADMTAEMVEAIVKKHVGSPAMMTIIPMQDILGMSDKLAASDFKGERINVPDNPHNLWTYRLHLTLDELKSDEEFAEKMRSIKN